MSPKNKTYDYDGVYFTMGPISINQFAEFSKHGLGAIRLFQYIKTLQGLTKEKWIKVDNVNMSVDMTEIERHTEAALKKYCFSVIISTCFELDTKKLNISEDM